MYWFFLTPLPFYFLKVTKFLVKISQFEFLVMTEQSILIYKRFVIKYSKFYFIFCLKIEHPLTLKKVLPFLKFGWRKRGGGMGGWVYFMHLQHIWQLFTNIILLTGLDPRSSHLQMLYKMGVLKSCSIFTGKHRCWSLFLIKFNKKRLQHRCLPENIAKFVARPFFRAHLSASVTPPPLPQIFLPLQLFNYMRVSATFLID